MPEPGAGPSKKLKLTVFGPAPEPELRALVLHQLALDVGEERRGLLRTHAAAPSRLSARLGGPGEQMLESRSRLVAREYFECTCRSA